MASPQLVPPEDHIKEGLSRVISQYRGKPRLNTYWAIFLDQLQQIEDAIHATVAAWSVTTAVGWRLRVIGLKVGQPNVSPDDEIQRLFTMARIRANRSIGKIEDLDAIATILLPGYTRRFLSQNIYFSAPASTKTRAELNAVQAMLQLAAPSGVRIWLDEDWGIPLTRASIGECAAAGSTVFATTPGGHDSITTDPNAGLYSSIVSPL
jgi:hypothetical protein